MNQLVQLLNEYHLTISAMESLTGGLFAKEITGIPGASKVFLGGIVSYSNQAKIDVGEVEAEIIEKYGAISKECAESMAYHVKEKFQTSIGISFTGNAGPSTEEGKENGLVYSSIAIEQAMCCFEDHLNGTRSEIRAEIVRRMIERVSKVIREIWGVS